MHPDTHGSRHGPKEQRDARRNAVGQRITHIRTCGRASRIAMSDTRLAPIRGCKRLKEPTTPRPRAPRAGRTGPGPVGALAFSLAASEADTVDAVGTMSRVRRRAATMHTINPHHAVWETLSCQIIASLPSSCMTLSCFSIPTRYIPSEILTSSCIPSVPLVTRPADIVAPVISWFSALTLHPVPRIRFAFLLGVLVSFDSSLSFRLADQACLTASWPCVGVVQPVSCSPPGCPVSS